MSAGTLDTETHSESASIGLRTHRGDAGPDDVDPPEGVPVVADEHGSIASAPIPGHGTE